MVLPVDPARVCTGDKVDVGMRPENISMGPGLNMKVRVLERLGGASITHGVMADGLRLCAALPGDTAVQEGETISVSVNPVDCHVFDAKGAVLRRRMAPALAA